MALPNATLAPVRAMAATQGEGGEEDGATWAHISASVCDCVRSSCLRKTPWQARPVGGLERRRQLRRLPAMPPSTLARCGNRGSAVMAELSPSVIEIAVPVAGGASLRPDLVRDARPVAGSPRSWRGWCRSAYRPGDDLFRYSVGLADATRPPGATGRQRTPRRSAREEAERRAARGREQRAQRRPRHGRAERRPSASAARSAERRRHGRGSRASQPHRRLLRTSRQRRSAAAARSAEAPPARSATPEPPAPPPGVPAPARRPTGMWCRSSMAPIACARTSPSASPTPPSARAGSSSAARW